MNSEQQQQIQPVVYPEGGSCNSGNNYYYDPSSASALYIPYVPEMPVSSQQQQQSDWYVSAPQPSANQQQQQHHWYSTDGGSGVACSGSAYFSALGYPFYPSVYTSEVESAAAAAPCVAGPWEAWPIASPACSNSPCAIQTDSPYLYTWTDSHSVQDKQHQQQQGPTPNTLAAVSSSQPQQQYGIPDGMNGGVDQLLSLAIGLPVAEDHIENSQGASIGDPLNGNPFMQTNVSLNSPEFNSSKSLLRRHSYSGLGDAKKNPIVFYPQLFVDTAPTSIIEQNSSFEATKVNSSPFIDLGDSKTQYDYAEDSCSKYQESLTITDYSSTRSIYDKRSVSSDIVSRFSSSLHSNNSAAVNPAVVKKDKFSNYNMLKVNKDEKYLEPKKYTSLVTKLSDLNLGNSIPCFPVHEKLFPSVDFISSNCYPPAPNYVLPQPLKENDADPVVPCVNSPERSMVHESSDPQQSFRPPLKTNTSSECLHAYGGTEYAAMKGVDSEGPKNDAADPKNDAAELSSKRNGKFIQTIYNLSLMLLANVRVESSDDLDDCDSQALQSAIYNLSEYMVKRIPNSMSIPWNSLKCKQLQHSSCGAQKFCKGEDMDLGKRESSVKSLLESSPELGSPDIVVSKLEKAKCPDTIYNEEKSILENLKESLQSELAERSNKIHLYRNLLTNAEKEIDLLKIENRFVKMELEMEKLKSGNKGMHEAMDSERFKNKGYETDENILEKEKSDHETVLTDCHLLATSNRDVNKAISENEGTSLNKGKSVGSDEETDSDISQKTKATDRRTSSAAFQGYLIDVQGDTIDGCRSVTGEESGIKPYGLQGCDSLLQLSQPISQSKSYRKEHDSMISGLDDLSTCALAYAKSEGYGSDVGDNLIEQLSPRSGSFSFGVKKLANNPGSGSFSFGEKKLARSNLTNFVSESRNQTILPVTVTSVPASIWNVNKDEHEELKNSFPSIDNVGTAMICKGNSEHANQQLIDELSVKIVDSEKPDDVESNSLIDRWDQDIINLIDESSNAETPREYRFVSCQSNFENLIVSKDGPESSFCSDSESGWEEVSAEYQIFP